MKPSEIKAEIRKLYDTPGMFLSREERLQYLSADQFHACEQANSQIEELNAQYRAIQERVAAKLNRLRQHMIQQGRGDEFAKFRFCSARYEGQYYPATGYQQDNFPIGGLYEQAQDDREAFLDAKLKLEGL